MELFDYYYSRINIVIDVDEIEAEEDELVEAFWTDAIERFDYWEYLLKV